ncbi:MAG TPA: dihydroneopterin aldolase family protein [Thermoplasmata archaeon]|nr:dihydroneopterin aldolase family protein [Thermoplasmata archaeon]
MTAGRTHRAALTRREALVFEAGIKLGGVFHQYLGTPVSDRTARGLARTIERAVGLQPFVRSVRVSIVPARGGPVGRGRFGYRYLTAEMLRASVTLSDGPERVTAVLEPRADLRYPLMSVDRVQRRSPGATGASRSRRRGRRSAPRSGSSGG